MVMLKVWVYDETGLKVEISEEVEAQHAKAWVKDVLSAGWLVNPPGVQGADEQSEIINAVVRMETKKGDTFIVLYSVNERLKYAWNKVYMNSEQDVKDFLQASGFSRLEDIPLYDGEAAPQRDSKPSITRYITRTPKQFRAVSKATGKLNEYKTKEGETKTKPEFKVVRYVPVSELSIVDKPTEQLKATGTEGAKAGGFTKETAEDWKAYIQARYPTVQLVDFVNALRVSRLSEWQDTVAAATATVDMVMANKRIQPVKTAQEIQAEMANVDF